MLRSQVFWIAAAIILAVGAKWMFTPKNKWRYKMTVDVETPEGVRSGSVVREVTRVGAGMSFIGESRPQWRVEGQALVVDLPNDRKLFATMRGADGYDVEYGPRIADRAMGEQGGWIRDFSAEAELFPTHPARPLLKHTSAVPLLVAFADLNDSKSVEIVPADSLAAHFGPGYALKRIRIGITKEPVTTGITQVLPWLGPHPEPSLKRGHGPYERSGPATLKNGDFLRRI